jgi:hypothetical protein
MLFLVTTLQVSRVTLMIPAIKSSLRREVLLWLASKFISNAIQTIRVMYNFSATRLLLISWEIHGYQMGYLLWHKAKTVSDMTISYIVYRLPFINSSCSGVICNMHDKTTTIINFTEVPFKEMWPSDSEFSNSAHNYVQTWHTPLINTAPVRMIPFQHYPQIRHHINSCTLWYTYCS